MKKIKLLIRSITFAGMLIPCINAFSQVDDSTSAKKNKKAQSKDNMPVIKPESHDKIPVIHPQSKDSMPTVNPNTVSKLSPKSIGNQKKKRTYKNNYNYPSWGNHFRDNRIGIMVGQSDT